MEEDQHHKEVYAHYGLAAFKAQCLEEELINMLSLHGFAEKPPLSQTDVRAMFEQNELLTLGRLVKEAMVRVKFAKDMKDSLDDALSKRNRLMHGYFAARIEKFQTTEGRDTLISELQEFQSAFGTADKYVQIVTKLLRKTVGLTDDMIYAELVRGFGKEEADEIVATSKGGLRPKWRGGTAEPSVRQQSLLEHEQPETKPDPLL